MVVVVILLGGRDHNGTTLFRMAEKNATSSVCVCVCVLLFLLCHIKIQVYTYMPTAMVVNRGNVYMHMKIINTFLKR